ncbi:uncharacterized protein LOC136082574 [Hydra vulgaris]|uniref:Uncharacterized protein LOC136082574 n=1 Tax=Hydra vulgaris TaxID=6087 RepID=A0ABM4C8U5_HYDVU
MFKLGAVIKGLNMGLNWKMEVLHICTDSKAVFHWVTDAHTRKSRLRTKASNEMLIRRRLQNITNIVDEYQLKVDIKLVASEVNLVYALTSVPNSWLKLIDKSSEMAAKGIIRTLLSSKEIEHVHRSTGHYGVKKTLNFGRKIDPSVSKEEIKQVVEKCIACQSIDPSPIKWPKGEIEVKRTWQRLGIDITHYERQHYLTLIDSEPTRYAIWRYLKDQTSTCVIQELNAIFLERGGLDEILTHNDTAFQSTLFLQFVNIWNVKLRFRCAYAPSENRIAERCHQTVKRTAKRVPCSIRR